MNKNFSMTFRTCEHNSSSVTANFYSCRRKKKIENSFSMIDWPETFLDTAQALRFGNLSWVFQINLLQIQDTHVAPIKQHWLLKHPSCHTF